LKKKRDFVLVASGSEAELAYEQAIFHKDLREIEEKIVSKWFSLNGK